MLNRAIKLLILGFSFLFIIACGQKGPLYLPNFTNEFSALLQTCSSPMACWAKAKPILPGTTNKRTI